MAEFKDLSIQDILDKMERMRSTKPQTINGARAASIHYSLLHEELNRREFKGDRPPRRFTHPSMRS